jgi:cell division septation protein DedD
MAAEDTEITLGAGKLLGLFFMLAAVCGVFFAVGYSLGKTSAREQALNNRAADQAAGKISPEPKSGLPSASSVAGNETPGKEPEPDLTFYKVLTEKGQKGSVESPAHEPKPEENGVLSGAKRADEQQVPESKVFAVQPVTDARNRESSPMATQALPEQSTGGAYVVQIAAVSHEEDAAALAGALRKKSYSAAVVNNPAGKDKLFHVVLGPYASLQEAEAMKVRLQGEGYNPIVKR